MVSILSMKQSMENSSLMNIGIQRPQLPLSNLFPTSQSMFQNCFLGYQPVPWHLGMNYKGEVTVRLSPHGTRVVYNQAEYKIRDNKMTSSVMMVSRLWCVPKTQLRQSRVPPSRCLWITVLNTTSPTEFLRPRELLSLQDAAHTLCNEHQLFI